MGATLVVFECDDCGYVIEAILDDKLVECFSCGALFSPEDILDFEEEDLT